MIEDVNDKNYYKVIKFLEDSKLITNIQEDLVKCGSLITEDNNILGMITYEINKADLSKAVLRYFVFKKIVEFQKIKELIEYVTVKLKQINVNKLIGLVSNKDVLKVMFDFGFYELDPRFIFIDEECYELTNFKNVIPLALDI